MSDKRRVVVNDRMQKAYVYYRTEPVGCDFAPGFEPQLTPKQMLELGVFGGGSGRRCCTGRMTAARSE